MGKAPIFLDTSLCQSIISHRSIGNQISGKSGDNLFYCSFQFNHVLLCLNFSLFELSGYFHHLQWSSLTVVTLSLLFYTLNRKKTPTQQLLSFVHIKDINEKRFWLSFCPGRTSKVSKYASPEQVFLEIYDSQHSQVGCLEASFTSLTTKCLHSFTVVVVVIHQIRIRCIAGFS